MNGKPSPSSAVSPEGSRACNKQTAAIAAATVLPRHVLGETATVEQLLLGQPFNATLRWCAAPGQPLAWRRNG